MSYLKKSFGNISWLAAGTLCQQVISIVGAIYIPKMLGVVSFGQYSTINAFVGMFTILTLSGMTKTIIREGVGSRKRLVYVLERTVGVRNLFSTLAALLCMLSALFTGYDSIVVKGIFILSLELFLGGLQGSLQSVFQASHKMKYLALLGSSKSIVVVAGSVGLLFAGFSILTILLWRIFSGVVFCLFNWLAARKFAPLNYLSKPVWDKKLLKSGFIFSGLSFLLALSTRLDIVMISFMGTPVEVGLYALAFTAVQKLNILRNTVSNGLFPVISEWSKSGKISLGKILLLTGLLVLLSAVGATVVNLFVEPVVLYIWGEKFRGSILIFKVLVYYVALTFAVMPVGLLMQALKQESILLITTAVSAVLNVVLNIGFYRLYGLVGIAYSTLVTYTINALLSNIIGLLQLKRIGILR